MKRLLLLIKSDELRERWLSRLAQIAITKEDPHIQSPT